MKHCLLLASLFLTAASGAAEPPTEKLVLKNDRAELVFSGGKTFLFESYRSEGAEMLPAGGSATHPWRLVYRGVNGENPNLLPRNGYYDGGERLDTLGMAALRFTWRVASRRRSGPCCARDRCARGRFRTSRVASRCRSARRVGAHRSGVSPASPWRVPAMRGHPARGLRYGVCDRKLRSAARRVIPPAREPCSSS